jgi:hypothetical protein
MQKIKYAFARPRRVRITLILTMLAVFSVLAGAALLPDRSGRTAAGNITPVSHQSQLSIAEVPQISGLKSTAIPNLTSSPNQTDQLVVSQIYGGGGTPGATYRNSFIEVFNQGSNAVDLRNWGFWITSATGAFNTLITFGSSFTILPGQYGLFQIGDSS